MPFLLHISPFEPPKRFARALTQNGRSLPASVQVPSPLARRPSAQGALSSTRLVSAAASSSSSSSSSWPMQLSGQARRMPFLLHISSFEPPKRFARALTQNGRSLPASVQEPSPLARRPSAQGALSSTTMQLSGQARRMPFLLHISPFEPPKRFARALTQNGRSLPASVQVP